MLKYYISLAHAIDSSRILSLDNKAVKWITSFELSTSIFAIVNYQLHVWHCHEIIKVNVILQKQTHDIPLSRDIYAREMKLTRETQHVVQNWSVRIV